MIHTCKPVKANALHTCTCSCKQHKQGHQIQMYIHVHVRTNIIIGRDVADVVLTLWRQEATDADGL